MGFSPPQATRIVRGLQLLRVLLAQSNSIDGTRRFAPLRKDLRKVPTLRPGLSSVISPPRLVMPVLCPILAMALRSSSLTPRPPLPIMRLRGPTPTITIMMIIRLATNPRGSRPRGAGFGVHQFSKQIPQLQDPAPLRGGADASSVWSYGCPGCAASPI